MAERSFWEELITGPPSKRVIPDPKSEWRFIPDEPDSQIRAEELEILPGVQLMGGEPDILEPAIERKLALQEVRISEDELPQNYRQLLRSPEVVRQWFDRQRAELADYMREAVRSAKRNNVAIADPRVVYDNWVSQQQLQQAVRGPGRGALIPPQTQEELSDIAAATFAYPTGIAAGFVEQLFKSFTIPRRAGKGRRPITSVKDLLVDPLNYKVYQQHEEEVQKMLGKPFMDQFSADIRRNITGFVELGRLMAGGGIKPEDWEAEPFSGATRFFKSGSEIGKTFTAGMVAANYSLISHLINGNISEILAMPLTNAMVMYPALKALPPALRVTPGIKRLMAVLDQRVPEITNAFTEVAKKTAATTAASPLTAVLMYKHGLPFSVANAQAILGIAGTSRYAITVLAHWLDRAWHAYDKKWERVLEHIIKNEPEVKASITGAAEELARAIERDEVKLAVDPDGTLRDPDTGAPVDPNEALARFGPDPEELLDMPGPETKPLPQVFHEPLGTTLDGEPIYRIDAETVSKVAASEMPEVVKNLEERIRIAYEQELPQRLIDDLEVQNAYLGEIGAEDVAVLREPTDLADPSAAIFEPAADVESMLVGMYTRFRRGDINEADFVQTFDDTMATHGPEDYSPAALTNQEKLEFVNRLEEQRREARERYQIREDIRWEDELVTEVERVSRELDALQERRIITDELIEKVTKHLEDQPDSRLSPQEIIELLDPEERRAFINFRDTIRQRLMTELRVIEFPERLPLIEQAIRELTIKYTDGIRLPLERAMRAIEEKVPELRRDLGPGPKKMHAGLPLPKLLKELEPILKKLGIVYEGATMLKDKPYMYGFHFGEGYTPPIRGSSFNVTTKRIKELGVQGAFQASRNRILEQYGSKKMYAGLPLPELFKGLEPALKKLGIIYRGITEQETTKRRATGDVETTPIYEFTYKEKPFTVKQSRINEVYDKGLPGAPDLDLDLAASYVFNEAFSAVDDTGGGPINFSGGIGAIDPRRGDPRVIESAKARMEALEPPEPPGPVRKLQPPSRWELPLEIDDSTGKPRFEKDYQDLIEDLAHDPIKFADARERIRQKFTAAIFDEMVRKGEDPQLASELAPQIAVERLQGLTPEQVAQVQYGKRVPTDAVNATFRDPFYQKMVDELIDQVTEYMPEEGFVLQEVEPILGAIKGVGQFGKALERSEVQQLITSVLRDTSVQLLRSDKLRKRVAKSIEKETGIPVDELDILLKKMGESHLLEQPFSYTITLADGRTANLFNEFVKKVKELDQVEPGTMNGIRAEALRRMTGHLASETSRRAFKKDMVNEAGRFAADNMVQYTDNIVRGVLIENKVPPNMLTYTPDEISMQIRSSKERYITELVDAGIPEDLATAKVNHLARQIDKDYIQPGSSLDAAAPANVEAVHKVFNSTMDWQLKSLNTLNHANNWYHKLNNAMKANLTARNIPTHLHNFIANSGHTALRRGVTPLGVLNSLRRTSDIWGMYKSGKLRKTDPSLYNALRELERSGVLDTTRVEAELGVGFLDSMKHLDKFPKPMQQMYRWGDNVFKLDETIVQLENLRSALDDLAPGEWIKVRTSKAKEGIKYLQKTEDGNIAIRDGSVLPEAQLNKTLIKAAAEKAQDIFFDYSEISNFGKMVKTAPLLGIASPFFSWFWKALDVPVVKKGLVTRVIESPDVILNTNSSSVNAKLAARRLALAARRNSVLGGMRAEFQRMPDDKRRDFLKRIGKDVGIILLDNLEDPRYASYQNWEAVDFTQPTNILLKLGTRAYAETLEPEEIYPALPDGTLDKTLSTVPANERAGIRKRQKLFAKYKGGHMADATDVLQIVGLSGTPLMDMITTIEEGVKREDPLTWGKIYGRFGKALIGGVFHSASMVALGLTDPASPAGLRQFALSSDSKEQEDALKWAMRTMFKMGPGYAWRTRRVANAEKKYMADFKRMMTNVLKKDLERRRQALLKMGDKEAAIKIKKKQKFFQQIINETIREMNTEWRTQRSKYLDK